MTGQTWVCLASGPSLNWDDVEYCRQRGWHIATCNDSINLAPDTRLHHAFDARWWDAYHPLAHATGAALSTCNVTAARKYRIRHVRYTPGGGCSMDPLMVYAGGPLSGYQLIQLVAQAGAARIVLLGYDMQHSGGAAHFNGDHPDGWPNAQDLSNKLPHFAKLATACPVPIINASRATAIETIPRMALEDIE